MAAFGTLVSISTLTFFIPSGTSNNSQLEGWFDIWEFVAVVWFFWEKVVWAKLGAISCQPFNIGILIDNIYIWNYNALLKVFTGDCSWMLQLTVLL